MTSLVLFDSERAQPDDFIAAGSDWGTGKRRAKSSSDPNAGHPTGTFVYNVEPIAQNYRNTDITLSHVRINDELIPAPFHTTLIQPHQIPLKFPSNHPFSSHISEKALFPSASISLDDHPSTDTDPYVVTHKIRGNPYRREVHYPGSPRHGPSKWPNQQYMQLPRSLSDVSSSSIYPWPRKIFAPNAESSSLSAVANIVKNKERTLFESTYQSDFSNGEGLGSHVLHDTTATLLPTETLKPHFKKTLDPARPIEGMQASHIHGSHRQPSALDKQRASIHFTPREPIKIMSEDEHFDDQLRNGTDYVNLPAQMFPSNKVPTWIPRPEPVKTDSPQEPEIRFLHHLKPSTDVPQIARDHRASHQQIEAENRLQQIQVIRPEDNLNVLNLKYRTLQSPRHARPILPQYHDAYVNTLYDQVGTYVQERSGLYHTENYNPNALTQAIPELENVRDNPDELERALKDEDHLGDLLDYGERVQEKSKPKLFQYKAIGDYQAARNRLLNKFNVPQDSTTVDARLQEGNQPFIQRESTYGQAFNTRKYLQENTLSSLARSDPTRLMSTTHNGNLERARSFNGYPMKPLATSSSDQNEEKFNDLLQGPFLSPSPYSELYATKYITEHTDGYSRRSTNRVYDSPFKVPQDMTAYKFYEKKQTPVAGFAQTATQLPNAAKYVLRLPGPELVSRFVGPKPSEPDSIYQRSYKDISYHERVSTMEDTRPNVHHNRLSMKDDDQRFGRTTDGRVKQWKLIDLQDRWTKSKAQRDYHLHHPEAVPYVGDGTMQAKKEILIDDLIQRQRMMTVR